MSQALEAIVRLDLDHIRKEVMYLNIVAILVVCTHECMYATVCIYI